jgi:hypothetical protein
MTDIQLKIYLLALPTKGKDIVVFRFIIEYSSSFKGFWPLGNNK